MSTFKQMFSFFLLLATFSLEAQQVVRGPYLQSGGTTSIIIKWRTDAPTNASVWFGTSPNSLAEITSVNNISVDHEILLQGLTPATKYYYAVGTQNNQLVGADQDHYFFTSPTVGEEKPTKIWVLGDSGTADHRARNVRDGYFDYMNGEETDLILMLGDNAYTDGTDEEYQTAVFENMYEEMLIHAPLWSCPGNHDYVSADKHNKTGPYYDIFTFPTNGEIGGLPSGNEGYYSFDYGNIHFIGLDSQHPGIDPGGSMPVWLENDLNTTNQDWIIVYFHFPPYTKGSHDSDESGSLTRMRENIVPILEAGGADLVLTGHSHSYERSYLINGHYGYSETFSPEMIVDGGDGRLDGNGAYQKVTEGVSINNGTVYIVAGSSGKISDAPLDHPAMFFSTATLGSLSLEIEGDQLDLKFVDTAGEVDDYFTIHKVGLPTGNAPTISLGYPNPSVDRLVNEHVSLTADAQDADNDLVKVEFYVNDQYTETDYNAPYEFDFSTTVSGTYSITARATDGEGNVAFSNTSLVTIIENTDPGPGTGITVVSFPSSINGVSSDTPVTWNEPVFSTDCLVMEIIGEDASVPCTPISVPNTTDLGTFGNSQYVYYASASTWQEAKAYSESVGGTLASIESAEENDFIQNAIPSNTTWIGFTDEMIGGEFAWTDGQSVNYTNWGAWRPKSYTGTARFVQLRKSDGKWYDKANNFQQSFVIKIPCTGSTTGSSDTVFVASEITVTQTSPIPNGGLFPEGNSTVTYLITDDCGNTQTASFTVTIPGSAPPAGSGLCSGEIPTFAGFDYLVSNSSAHYYLSFDKYAWNDGQNFCQAYGGSLASIGSEEENNIIFSGLSDLNDWVVIGLSDQAEEGIMSWADGSVFAFDNLDPAILNNASKNFGLMNPWNSTWKLESKYVRKRVIMEVPCGTDGLSVNRQPADGAVLIASPNPVENHLSLRFEDAREYHKIHLVISDIYGDVVLESKEEVDSTVSQQWEISTTNWKQGIYIVYLNNGLEETTQRVVKIDSK